MTTSPDTLGPPRLSLAALFLKFLRFGFLAFGGPVAQIAMIRRTLVDEERWISSPRFNRLLAVMQVLPGPEAHELCVHMGMMARGRIGGLLAGLGFMLPGFVLMLAAAWLYERFIAGQSSLTGLLLGVQIVVVAIIIRAVHRIGSHVLEDRLLWMLAIGAFIASLLHAPFWIPLAACGLIYALEQRPWAGVAIAVVAVFTAILFGLHLEIAPSAVAISAEPSPQLAALFVAGLKGGLLTFGGAYTAIPYVRADTVGRGWLPDGVFLDGVALAGVLPAPLVIFGTFTGYVVGGWAGALAVTAGIFLPAFAFSMVLFNHLEAVVENPALHRLLAGVAAAVVGVIAATSLQLAWTTAQSAPSLWIAGLIFIAALAAAWRLKPRWMPLLILGGAAAGGLALY
ncbi:MULTISPECIES: chromate efflux transporter [Brevundimonas]|uniref:Chromate efflux transporter n=1 Tax=Brevundimonas diminuta TaxID=293 RepID=A0A410P021_BREDI|nr:MULTISPECIES: chromate efflux transporter [Brevundimonas]OMG57832.1 chromate transporter [Brevundimonas sp. ZS04]QAT15395.1 chromate efflux transporter [Brevundimonas diminuta]QQB90393.1 chromate efflux transporter [Brevundimonas diminuta]GEC00126.1 chromate transporter [Brevundimonas diminuta]